jgi:alpha-galactosidase
MKLRLAFTPGLLALTITFAGFAHELAAQQTTLAATPPMGWNSWDSYGLTIDESEFKANEDWLAKNLKQYGWQYAVIDEGWYLANPRSQGKPAWQYILDDHGRYLPAPNRFPSATGGRGLKPVADYAHSLGLKFGIHIIRGIPREAVRKNLPIAGSSYRAADAADRSDTCAWNPDNYGVKPSPAGQAYYDSLARLYASWGLDFIKVDCISSPYRAEEIRMFSLALKRSGRLIVLSLSPGPTPLGEANEVRKYAQMWRISGDVWDHWGPWPGKNWSQGVKGQFSTAASWAPYVESGHWPDADMLPLGFLGPRPGESDARPAKLTRDEQRTLLTLWSIFRSPLFMGGNLTRNDSWTTSLLSNSEVIAVDQHSKQGRPVITTPSTVVWTARAGEGNSRYIAVFNIGDTSQTIERAWKDLELAGASYNLRDLWEHKNLGSANSLKVRLQPHASVLYRLTPGR